jgi:hypothetical protein
MSVPAWNGGFGIEVACGLLGITPCSTDARRRNTMQTPRAAKAFTRNATMADTHQMLVAIAPVMLLRSLGIVGVIVTRHIGLRSIFGYLVIELALRAAGHTLFKKSTTIARIPASTIGRSGWRSLSPITSGATSTMRFPPAGRRPLSDFP